MVYAHSDLKRGQHKSDNAANTQTDLPGGSIRHGAESDMYDCLVSRQPNDQQRKITLAKTSWHIKMHPITTGTHMQTHWTFFKPEKLAFMQTFV